MILAHFMEWLTEGPFKAISDHPRHNPPPQHNGVGWEAKTDSREPSCTHIRICAAALLRAHHKTRAAADDRASATGESCTRAESCEDGKGSHDH